MSVTFTKLFTSITESTVWFEPDSTRIVWVAMLAMADRKGRVFASVPGLAHRARVTEDQCETALTCFLSPDPKSRTKDYDGRRIAEIDGGWILLNHEKYRNIRDEETILESKRKYINNRRKREREQENGGGNTPSVESCRHENLLYTEAEAEAEAEADTEEGIVVVIPNQTQDSAESVRLAWNTVAGDCGLQPCRKISGGRMKSVRERLRDPDWRENYPSALDRLRGMKWIRGSNGFKPRGIDWFLRPDTLTKILEGSYDDICTDYSTPSPDGRAGRF